VLSDGPLVAFVATARPDEARRFYVELLGLQLTYEDDFALAFKVGSTPLRVTKVAPDQFHAVGYTILGWEVPDIKLAVDSLVTRGVTFERFGEWMQQDDRGIWAAPGGAQVAWFKDPDGNTLSVTQMPQEDGRTSS
jgi:catechol 2,3-dioxygenase-like lactoylglutathione lyase family enzyme